MAPHAYLLPILGLTCGVLSIPFNTRQEMNIETSPENGTVRLPVRFEPFFEPSGAQSTAGKYYATVYLGDQDVDLTVDTSSHILWSFAPGSGASENSSLYYDATQSNTSYEAPNHEFHISYGLGSVSGKMVNDKVCLGSLCLGSTLIGTADTLSPPDPQVWEYLNLHGGILPLGSLASTAVNSGSAPMNSLTRALSYQVVIANFPRGYLELGQPLGCEYPLDAIRFPLDTSTEGYSVQNVQLEVNNTSSRNFRLMFDTSMPFSSFPEDVLGRYYESFTEQNASTREFVVPCPGSPEQESGSPHGSIPDLTITGDAGATLTLPGYQFAIRLHHPTRSSDDTSDVCFGAVQKSMNPAVATLGSQLFANYVVVFNLQASEVVIFPPDSTECTTGFA